jgi:uncharacterized protein YuzE
VLTRYPGDGVGSDREGVTAEDIMKVKYDEEVDVLTIEFSDAPVEESDEDKPGVILDYDKDGNIVGMEILNASKRVQNPKSVEYAVA